MSLDTFAAAAAGSCFASFLNSSILFRAALATSKEDCSLASNLSCISDILTYRRPLEAHVPGTVITQQSAEYLLRRFRACADRDAMVASMESGHGMLDHLGSSLSFPTKEEARARAPTLPHRAHLATVLCPAAGEGDEPSAGVSPLPHPRQGGLREAGTSLGVRLRLREDRRRYV